jgi:hypothetical protein
MSLKPTKQLSEKATVELLKEFYSPVSTPQLRAQKAKVEAMAAKIQKKTEGQRKPSMRSR